MEPTAAAMNRRLATARKIKGLMGENDVTQTRLGEKLGLTQGPVSDRLTGRRPFNTDELEEIADLFDVPITELLPPPRYSTAGDASNPPGRRDGGDPSGDDLRSRCFTDEAIDLDVAAGVQFAAQLTPA